MTPSGSQENDLGNNLPDALMSVPDDSFELFEMEDLRVGQIRQFLSMFRYKANSLTIPGWLNLAHILLISAEINTNTNAWAQVYRPIIEATSDISEYDNDGSLSEEAVNNFGLSTMLIILGSVIGRNIEIELREEYKNDKVIRASLECLGDFEEEATNIEELRERIVKAFKRAALIFGEFEPFEKNRLILDIHSDQRVMNVHMAGGGIFFRGKPIRLIFNSLSEAFASGEYSRRFFGFVCATNVLKTTSYIIRELFDSLRSHHNRRL